MSLRVVHVNCFIDPHDRPPEELLEAWATLPLVAGAVARAGADVTVLQSSRYAAVHHRDGVTYRFVQEPRPMPGGGAGLLPPRLADAVRRQGPDVVHFHGLNFPIHLRAVCSAGAPVLVQDHADQPGGRRSRLRRWGLHKAAAVAFTAKAQAEPFRSAGQLPSDLPILEIPESSSMFTTGDREEARARCGVFGDPALLWVGHLDANKDPLTILAAVRTAPPHLPGLQLWCAFGEAHLLPQVQARLRAEPALAERVHLLGRVPHAEIETLCRACDVFVLGSHREGSGYALLEALACGLPPVVSDIPSFRALTGDGAVGALAPPGDAEAFAARMVALAQRPRQDERARVAAHFAEHLSPDALGRRLLRGYKDLAAGARPK